VSDPVPVGGARQHVCLSYSGRPEFAARARRFLAEGLEDGMQVRLVLGDDRAALLDQVGGFGAVRRGAVQVQPLAGAYRAGAAVVEPSAQAAAYAEATDEAVAAGFSGLRVAADVTSLVGTREQLDAFARYEHLADRLTVDRPFSAMCGYDRSVLGEERVAQLACMHPLVEPDTVTPVRVFAVPGAAAGVAGEIDMAGRRLFLDALARAGVWAGGPGEVVLDARGLRFVDHQSLLQLAGQAERRAVTVVLRTRWPAAVRIVQLLGIAALRVEPAP
jgi:anti-anti-sigma regulatory factor